MRVFFKLIGGIFCILLIGVVAFYFMFLRGLPRPEVALKPVEFSGNEMPGYHDCFWMGPITVDSFNTAFPDGGAIYWPTVFKFPADMQDAYLEIQGSFPKARYLSIHSYQLGAVPYDFQNDQTILADEGSQNPFLTGTYTDKQNYTVRVYPFEKPQSDSELNAVYLGPYEKINTAPIWLRMYTPETDGDPTGGSGLPKVTLVKANGERIDGQEMCNIIQSPPVGHPDRLFASPVIPRDIYDEMVSNPDVRKAVFEDIQDQWTVFWDPRVSVSRLISPAISTMIRTAIKWGFIKKTSGFYANFDNEYVSMFINEANGNVIVLEGKLPRTPKTGAMAANHDDFDMRYWSLCTNEGLSSARFTDCIYDEQVTVDQDMNYTIVISKPENRPENATRECGVNWMDFGIAGDGAGNTDLAVLIMRNMLPNPKFKYSVQNIPIVGEEKATMGPYLPIPQYGTKAEFETRGCSAK